jgi:hypothetical protein
MKTYAPILIGGKPGFAIFYTFRARKRIWFDLDHGDSQGKGRECSHPDERFLTPSKRAGVDFDYAGPPIELDKFVHLPPERAGFLLSC